MTNHMYNAYKTTGFAEVFGWCDPRVLDYAELFDQFQADVAVTGNFGEIGVQSGKLFIGMHNLLHANEKSLAIDIFEDTQFNIDGSGNTSLTEFQNNLVKHGNPDIYTRVIREDSINLSPMDAFEIAKDLGKFRLFSVDGSHELLHTMSDILFAEAAICNGGIVILDDYYSPGWPEVHQAVAHLFIGRRTKLVPICCQWGKFFFTTLAYAETYKQRLKQHYLALDPGEPIKDVNFYGYSMPCLERHFW